MSSPLDTYLEQVAAHLTALPIKRRNEELVEMRQHLLNAVTVNKELGQSEKDAAANAVLQFGTAEDLGGSLVWAWKRERRKDRKSFWGAVTVMLLFLYVWSEFLEPRVNLGWIQNTCHVSHLTAYLLAFTLLNIPCLTLMGAAIGRLFPKGAVAGTAVVPSLLWGWTAIEFFQDNLGFARTFSPSEFDAWGYVAINFWYDIGFLCVPFILAPMLGAWLGSRRLQSAGRSRSVAGIESPPSPQ